MIRYMLDTNMVAYAKNRRPACVLENILKHDRLEICISSIVLGELEFGVFNSSKPEKNRLSLMIFLSGIAVLDFDEIAANEYGKVRYMLKKKPIGNNDTLIAAHAKSRNLILVTHNVREFSRVEGLELEDWADGTV